MKIVICPECNAFIPANAEKCPNCYIDLKPARRNWIGIVIKIVLALSLIFFVVVSIRVINFNSTLRKYVKNVPEDISFVNEINEKYEKLTFYEKKLIHKFELEYLNNLGKGISITGTVTEMNVDISFDKGIINGIYTGEVDGSIPNGNGKFDYIDNDGLGYVYEGEFTEGTITGKGTLLDENKKVYIGTFKNGRLNGEGSIYNKEGVLIEKGKYINGTLNGIGKMYDDKYNLIFNGKFNNGLPAVNEYRAACTEVQINDIEKNVNSHIGKNLQITGIVKDVVTNGNVTKYIISVGRGRNICIENKGRSKSFTIDDEIVAFGYCEGDGTYKDYEGISHDAIIIRTFYIYKNY